MEQAYEVGIGLALKGGVGKVVQQLIEEFTKLDDVLQKTQGSLNGLVSGMRLLRREAEGTANALKGAATAMDRAARAARGGVTGSRQSGTSSSDKGSGGIDGPTGRALVPYRQPGLPVPYRSSSRDYTTSGDPYTPYGGYSTSAPPRFSGGPLVPYQGGGGGNPPPPGNGFTLNGDPYGPPSGGLPAREFRQIPLNYKPDRLPADTRWMMRPSGMSSDPMMGGIGAGAGIALLDDTLKKSAIADDWLHRLAAQGLNENQQKQAYDKSFDVMKTVQGSGVLGNLQMLSEIQSVLQNPDEALAVLPEMARLNVALGRSTGGKVGDQVLSAMKGLEYRGNFTKADPKTGEQTIDTDKVQAFVKSELISSVVTGGLINPTQFLQFLRASGGAGANISDPSFFTRSLPLISALGASGAGRALQGFEQQFASGKMSEASANLMLEMGILQGGGTAKKNPYMRKSGMGQFFIDPRAFPQGIQMEATRSPDKFINEYLFPKIDAYLTKILGDQYTKASPADRSVMEQNFSSQLASRIPGGKEMSEIIRVKALIDRDQVAWDKASKLNLDQLLTINNPMVAGQAYTASKEGVQVAAGKSSMLDVIDGLTAVSGGLNALSAWAKENPAWTKAGLDAVGAALVALGVRSAAGLAMMALGGPAGLLAGVAGGVILLAAAAQKLDQYLKGNFPKIFTDAPLSDIQKNGIVKPWYLPGPGPHSPTPNWVTQMSHDLTHPFGGGAPNAPVMDFSPGHSNSSNPVPVVVTNGHDLVNGVASGISSHMNAPNTGTLGHDSRIDAGASWVGGP